MLSGRIKLIQVFFLLLATFVVGCGGADIATESPTEAAQVVPSATLTASDTPTPTFTPTATATPTLVPSNTPTPTNTSTPTPTQTLTPTPEPTNTATPTSSPTLVPTLPPPPPPTIPPPTEAPPEPAFPTWQGVPVVPGAFNAFVDSDGSYWYQVASSGGAVRQFYSSTIASAGWTVLLATGDDSFGSMIIEKGSCQTLVMYEAGGDATGVVILNGCS